MNSDSGFTEYKLDAETFQVLYSDLILRYDSIKDKLEFSDADSFEYDFINGENNPITKFISSWCSSDFIRIPSSIMDYSLDQLVKMEERVNLFYN